MDELSLMIIVPLLLSIIYILMLGNEIPENRRPLDFIVTFFVTMFFWWAQS